MKTKLFFILTVLLLPSKAMMGQSFEVADSTGAVKTDSFWSDWFVQMDLDMSLQNPYGYKFSQVFPNGKTFGIDLAVGKWFTHQVGVRGKLNWENGISIFKNDHANWLAPFDEPGKNMDKGGYVAAYGEVLLNLHNFFGNYRPDRVWNLSVYPRVGVNYNFGVSKGSLLISAGALNTYRLNDRWSLFADLAYVFTGSGFVGKTKEKYGTGKGSNSNGYFSIGLGAQMELGRTKDLTHRVNHTDANSGEEEQKGVLTNGIWDNWFVQGGMDMSLMNPYGCNFSKSIPKGMTFGLNMAAGKWFSPEFGLRGRVQWENGLIENKSVEWVPPTDDPRQNYKKGGLGNMSLDAMLNMTNVLAYYDPERKWHTLVFFRTGIITQFVDGSGSPLMGAGIQENYRLNDRLSLFGSIGYQVSTSEGMGVSTTGMNVSAGSNGFFDFGIGVVYDLGRNKFYRSSREKHVG